MFDVFPDERPIGTSRCFEIDIKGSFLEVELLGAASENISFDVNSRRSAILAIRAVLSFLQK